MSRQQELQRKKKEHYFKLQMMDEMEGLGLSVKKKIIVGQVVLWAYRKGVNVCNTDG